MPELVSSDILYDNQVVTSNLANAAVTAAKLAANAAVLTLAGTANAISVSSSTGAVTLSLPANVTVSNNLVVSGNLTVNGTTTTINTTQLAVSDNLVTLNADFVSGTPTENAGIEVLRGNSATTALRWNETSDKWEFTNDGTVYKSFGGAATVSSTTPTGPDNGTFWYNQDSGQMFVYYTDGTSNQWVEIGGVGGSSATVTTSDTAPTSPSTGQFWYDTTVGTTYIYYDSFWVEVGAAAYNSMLQYDAKGDILAATADNTATRLGVGTDGTTLLANSSAVTGLAWSATAPILVGTVTTKGDVLAGSAANTVIRLGVGTDGQVLVANSAATSGLSWGTPGENDQLILGTRIFG
jgi:hypothetical protein